MNTDLRGLMLLLCCYTNESKNLYCLFNLASISMFNYKHSNIILAYSAININMINIKLLKSYEENILVKPKAKV